MTEDIPSEFEEQNCFVGWLDIWNIPYCAVPNGAYLGNDQKARARQMNKLKQEGFQVGFPDLIIWEMRQGYGALIIEMKRRKKCKLSENQKEWIDKLNKLGYKAIVCKGADEAIQAVEEYIGREYFAKFNQS